MKKFLLLFMLAFAILISTAAAADIPDIRLLNPNQIKFERIVEFDTGEGRAYDFECLDKKGNEYVIQYVDFLTNKLGYTVVKHKDHKGFLRFDEWHLMYSGTENISPVVLKKSQYHVAVSCDKDWIMVMVANGINMVGIQSEFESKTQPAPVENNPPQITPLSTNQTSGADVPDFGQIGATYDHNQHNDDGSVTYIFKASGLSESRADEYVNKYISLLTSNNFMQTGYDKQKFSERVSKVRQSETWTFDYRGSKSISGLSDGKALHVKRVRNPQTGDTSFEIRVAKDLVFAGNYEAPDPPPPGKTTCSACGGDGKCRSCGGSGYIRIRSDYDQPCGVCRTSGRCSDCDGRGYR